MRGIVLCAAVLLAALAASPTAARADEIDPQIRQLTHSGSYKVRLAAAIDLSKTHDPRAVAALSTALIRDDESTIRRVCAMALAKIVDETTPASARKLALESLGHAAKTDRDGKVRTAARRALSQLDALRRRDERHHRGPPVFVNVGVVKDLTRRAPHDVEPRLAHVIKGVVTHVAPSYAVEWPGGGLPTQHQLDDGGTRGFYVAATVAILRVARRGRRSVVSCTVSIRVAPWNGTDGEERWEASKAASASGSGKAETGSSSGAVAAGIRDCVLAVGEEVAARQVVPFIQRIADNR
jgi:uncharacterized protein (UPF0147 family)